MNNTNLDALTYLYEKVGGDPADLPELPTNLDLLNAIAVKLGGEGGAQNNAIAIFNIAEVANSGGVSTQQKTVDLDLSDGNQTVNPDSGKALNKVVIKKPDTLVPENIKEGVVIAGVTGTYSA